MYVDTKDGHSLVIGAAGSGKTQTIIQPLINLSMLANESFVVNDIKGEMYKRSAAELKKHGYKTIFFT